MRKQNDGWDHYYTIQFNRFKYVDEHRSTKHTNNMLSICTSTASAIIHFSVFLCSFIQFVHWIGAHLGKSEALASCSIDYSVTNAKHHRRRTFFSWIISFPPFRCYCLCCTLLECWMVAYVCYRCACPGSRLPLDLISNAQGELNGFNWTHLIDARHRNCVVERCQSNGRRLWILYVISHLNDGDGASRRTLCECLWIHASENRFVIIPLFIGGKVMRIDAHIHSRSMKWIQWWRYIHRFMCSH